MLKLLKSSSEDSNSSQEFYELIRSANSPIFAISDFLPLRDKVHFFSLNKATRSLYNDIIYSNVIWERTYAIFPILFGG